MSSSKSSQERQPARSSGKRWSEWEIEYVLKHWRGSADSARISRHFWRRKQIHRSEKAIDKMGSEVLGVRGRNLEGFTMISKISPGTSSSTIRKICTELGFEIQEVSHCLTLVPNEALGPLRERLEPPKDWLSSGVAAKRAGMCPSRLREYLRDGEIEARRYCKNIWRVCPRSLADFIARQGRVGRMLASGRWLSSKEASAMLSVTTSELSRLIRDGRLKAEKVHTHDSMGVSYILETREVLGLKAKREASGRGKAGKWAASEVQQLLTALAKAKTIEQATAQLHEAGFRRTAKAIARQAARMGFTERKKDLGLAA